MLSSLSIRDVVLIERLDLHFSAGLTALTGETGAGKSILLDSLGLVLGARADSGLIRNGATQAVVTASFAAQTAHPVHTLLSQQGLDSGDDIVIRRVVTRDGRSRALVNDQPVSASFLKTLTALLIEIQGQHEQVGLADSSQHILLLDAFGVPDSVREDISRAYKAWRESASRLAEAERQIADAVKEEDFLRHAASELGALNLVVGEEDALAAERLRLQAGERRAEAIVSAMAELRPKDRRQGGPAAALRAAARAIARVTVPDGQVNPAGPAIAAIERAEIALAEAEDFLERLAASEEDDPRALEATEERLFALRAAARKHNVQVGELPALFDELKRRLLVLESGAADITALKAQTVLLRADYIEKSEVLSALRGEAARRLEAAIGVELPPLKLDRARFVVECIKLPESQWSGRGIDGIRFLIATNAGDTPGPMDKIVSGGELSRLMLAMKVVLSTGSDLETLIFDEVDAGIGGATAACVGERLARVADSVQVLVVTHSPQVAARASTQIRVQKRELNGRALTEVHHLTASERREEIARMLSGEHVTDVARKAAESLLKQ